MKVKIGSNFVKGAVIGAFLAVFFVVGFFTNNYMVDESPTGKVITNKTGEETEIKEKTIGKEEVADKVMNYLKSGPLSYPFVKDLSISSIHKDRAGEDLFYNLTLEFSVESNPFNNGIYYVPEDKDEQAKRLTLYVSKTGDYFFTSSPVSTEVQTQKKSGPVYQGP